MLCPDGHNIYWINSFSLLQGGGTLTPFLGNITTLKIISLSDSGLTGSLPSEISKLSKLAVLDISNNQFSGMIPSSFCQLGNSLAVLELSPDQMSSFAANCASTTATPSSSQQSSSVSASGAFSSYSKSEYIAIIVGMVLIGICVIAIAIAGAYFYYRREFQLEKQKVEQWKVDAATGGGLPFSSSSDAGSNGSQSSQHESMEEGDQSFSEDRERGMFSYEYQPRRDANSNTFAL